jgi:hypothetical protein
VNILQDIQAQIWEKLLERGLTREEIGKLSPEEFANRGLKVIIEDMKPTPYQESYIA